MTASGVLSRVSADVNSRPLAVKRRLREASLAQVELVFAGQQAVAEQPLGPLEPAALVKVSVVRDEDLADELGVAEQVERLGA